MEIEASLGGSQEPGLCGKVTISAHDDSGIGIADESGHEQMLNGTNVNGDTTKDEGSSPPSTLSSPSGALKNSDWDIIENNTVTSQEVSSDSDVITTKTVTTTTVTKVMEPEAVIPNGNHAPEQDSHVVSDEESIQEEAITPVSAPPKNKASRPDVLDNLPPADADHTAASSTQAQAASSPLSYDDASSDTVSEPDISPSALLEVEAPPSDGEEVEEEAIVATVKEAKCCVAITVTDYSDEGGESECEGEQLPQEEPEPEPKPEIPAVDYPRGLVCTDVETALEILKTRYKLTEVQNKKCIITLESPWWKEGEEPEAIQEEDIKRELKSEVHSSASPMGEMDKRISRKEQEIEYLLKQILDEEKRRADEAAAKKAEEEDQAVEPEVIECTEAPVANSAPDSAPKKKRGNIFQRMMGAIRKRLDRGRSQA